jgi:xylulokinase
MGWYLAIDLGTSGLKVGALSSQGDVLETGFAPIETKHLADGGSIQEADNWWKLIVETVNAIVTSGKVSPEECDGIGITGQFASTVAVSKEGEVIGPVMLWSDDRGKKLAKKVLGGPINISGYSPITALQWIRYTAGAPSTQGADPTGHVLYLREHKPEMYSRTEVFLEPVDFIAFKLTGRKSATQASMIGSWLTDNRKKGNGEYVPSLIRRSGRDISKLPALIDTGSVVGKLSNETAMQLSLTPDIDVFAGLPDLHTAWLGSGAVEDFAAHLSISTTGWISAQVPFKRTDILHSIASVPGLSKGRYLIINNQETSGVCLQWFREKFLAGDLTGKAPSYDEITAAADMVPAGSNGTIFTPWLKGERSPIDDRDIRASFINIDFNTSQSTFARAVLEGVALNARWLLDYTEKFAKKKFETLRVIGGGAQSDVWCQIYADVLNRSIERPTHAMHANIRGAAFGVALAQQKIDLNDVARLVKVEKTFMPNPRSREIYDSIYKNYIKIYGTQRKLFRALNKNNLVGRVGLEPTTTEL